VLIVIAAGILYFVLCKKTPYCEAIEGNEIAVGAHCDYLNDGFTFYQKCKPCPNNAYCYGTKMVSSQSINNRVKDSNFREQICPP
jgi:hypothetical protein